MIFETVKAFLQKHHEPGRPLLLGFSGGADSLALCHLLKNVGEVHLAHVDHGWRPESAREAEELAELAKKWGLPFHAHRLETVMGENEAREARLRFFSQIYREGNFQALLLAHHADDQAETVLKRVLEGSSLFALGGLQETTHYQGMPIWRPLLNIPKGRLLAFLEEQGVAALDDSSNRDPKYLRARMRTQIFPELSKTFGKEIGSNLQRLGETAQELKDYLTRKTAPYLDHIQRGPFGSYLDFTPFLPMEKVELKALLKSWMAKEEVLLSHESFETLIHLIQSKEADRSLQNMEIDRGRVFVLRGSLPCFSFRRPLVSQIVGGWEIKIGHGQGHGHGGGWREWWSGRVHALLPAGEYELIPPATHLPYPRTSPIKKLWCSQQVPAFLRESLPLIAQNGRVVHEFLTGRTPPFFEGSGIISLEIRGVYN
jgi:tRNA(Ile)-lysidine synthase